MNDLTPETIAALRKQFDEMMASKGQPDHDDHLHDFQCFVLNCAPQLIAAAEENARLRAVVETAKADLQRIIDGTLMELESERSGLAANSLDPDEHDRRYYVARHEGALEQLEFLWTALRGMAERHGLRAALDAK